MISLIKFSFFNFAFFIIFGGQELKAQVMVGVLDSAVEYEHELLSDFIATDVLKKLSLTLPDGKSINWYDFNVQCLKHSQEKLKNHKTKNANMAWQLSTGQKPVDGSNAVGSIFETLTRIAISKDFKAALNEVGNLVHGTHVTGIILLSKLAGSKQHDPDSVKVVNFPLFCAYEYFHSDLYGDIKNKKLTGRQIKKLKMSKAKEIKAAEEKMISQIIKGFQEAKISVLNMSIGSHVKGNKKMLKNRSNFFARVFHVGKINELAVELTTMDLDSLHNIVKSLKDTVIVLAAGNENGDNDKIQHPIYQQNSDNLLFVAAFDDKKNDLASFSNYGANSVHLAASGVNIVSTIPASGLETFINQPHGAALSGTSMAAPLVASYLASLYVDQAAALTSPKAAIDRLLNHHTEVFNGPRLNGKIQGNRLLINAK